MNLFQESSDDDVNYRKNRKQFRRPVVLREVSKRSGSPFLKFEKPRESSVLSTKSNYKECHSCKLPIYQEFGDDLIILDKDYHADCFRCSQCSKTLSPENYNEAKGKFYCELDYNEIFYSKCYTCTKTIFETPVKFLNRNYHPLCFTCKKCSQPACPFTFREKNGSIYDEDCFHRLFSPKCYNCLEPIKNENEVRVALGTTFHKEHFICFECATPLPSNGFRQKNGNVYCEQDFHKLFTTRCASCDEPIIHRGIHALGKNWHADCCLRCEKCNKILREDGFIQEKGKAYCKKDWIKNFAPKCGALDCQKPVGEILAGNHVSELGRAWHKNCFICKDCNLILDAKSYYEFQNEPYCYACFHNYTCTDCLKVKSEREKMEKQVIREPKRVSLSSRRSMSPLSTIFKSLKTH